MRLQSRCQSGLRSAGGLAGPGGSTSKVAHPQVGAAVDGRPQFPPV